MIKAGYLPSAKHLKTIAWYISSWPAPVLHLLVLPLLLLAGACAAFSFSLASVPAILCVITFCMLLSAGILLFLARKLYHRTRDLDEYLLQSRKMAAIGEMSSGIAHELNTPLNIIVQEVELMRLALKEQNEETRQKEMSEIASQIKSQVQRCTEITHGMLNFARELHTVEQKTDINRLVEDMVIWVEKEAQKHAIAITRNYDPALPELSTDAPMLRHLVLNLLNNAVQATEKNGKVAIRTEYEKETFVLEVKDNGPGIAPQHLDSIFTPFFTTKAPGKGTGLGLPLCLAIVTRLGGTIQAGNHDQGGAVFQVRLPCR